MLNHVPTSTAMPKKIVREIPADPKKAPGSRWVDRPIRMAAYRWVSTEKRAGKALGKPKNGYRTDFAQSPLADEENGREVPG
ncbi:MAG TPA: hypothetical protein H9694_03305 [Firmicutes bacterium]|nr:hypothetical protein [Bacillota bacterium]